MTELIYDGDYEVEENRLKSIDYIDALLQSVRTVINCQRGKFYPNKNFGSHIIERTSDCKNDRLLDYARQAVSDIDGVFISEICMKNKTAEILVIINNEERIVSVNL